MKITIIGTGYVGLVSGTCFAETGNDVLCIDVDRAKIDLLQHGGIPIYEPGLEELVHRNVGEGRLRFSTNIKDGILHADMIFAAVPTPPDEDSRADLRFVKAVAKDFGEYVLKYTVFVMKSTVPVGTGEICEEIIGNELKKRGIQVPFDVASNPEFLREGSAIKDTMEPDRVIVGTESEKVKDLMTRLYAPYVSPDRPILFTNRRSSEIIKYASNAFLATKISFINEMATFCEKVGADITDIARGMGFDHRIGATFLNAGIGYGGSCFPKDIQAIIETGKEHGYSFQILDAVEAVNKSQKKKLYKKLTSIIPNVEDKVIAVLGLSFKPKTDDMRDAPSLKVIKKLQADGAIIRAFDPVAAANAKKSLSKVNITYCQNPYEAAENADALLIITEWDEFRNMDLHRIKSIMKTPLIIDGRNMFHPKDMKALGFKYYSVGRPS